MATTWYPWELAVHKKWQQIGSHTRQQPRWTPFDPGGWNMNWHHLFHPSIPDSWFVDILSMPGLPLREFFNILKGVVKFSWQPANSKSILHGQTLIQTIYIYIYAGSPKVLTKPQFLQFLERHIFHEFSFLSHFASLFLSDVSAWYRVFNHTLLMRSLLKSIQGLSKSSKSTGESCHLKNWASKTLKN